MAIPIVVDDREQKSPVVCALAEHEDVQLSIRRLSVGDYLVNEHLLFERKTLPDLMQSIIDGRLFRQAIRLVSSDFSPVLVLEGTHYDPDSPAVSREAVQGALISISLILGIPVLRSLNSQETAWLMLCADKQVRRIAEGGVQRPGYRPKGRRKRQLYILQGLPGIGRDKAELLLEVFGSVEKVFIAEYEDLRQVKGIGQTTAQRIRDMVQEVASDYR
ncbi:MAG: ERCC4 domain-containing protein [Desulfovermiculus sp.]|nr:ERCC4 domain-containing protein [Desulfovermiculus sp.]